MQQTEVQDQTASEKFYQTYSKSLIPILLKLFQNLQKEILPNSFYSKTTIITLIPKWDKLKKKKKLQPNTTDEYQHKYSQKILANQIQQYIKKNHMPWSSGLYSRIQGQFNIHINKRKD